MEERKVVKTVTYYAPYKKQVFTVPARDENGKFVPLKDGQGNPKYYKGNPMYQEILKEFVTQSGIRTGSTELLSYFRVDFRAKLDAEGKEVIGKNKKTELEPDNLDVYKALERLADDPGTKVEREASYKAKVNPEAYAKETELAKAHARIAELETQSVPKDAVQEMLEENKRLKADIDRLTDPKAKNSKG
jgi:hypothetical protein